MSTIVCPHCGHAGNGTAADVHGEGGVEACNGFYLLDGIIAYRFDRGARGGPFSQERKATASQKAADSPSSQASGRQEPQVIVTCPRRRTGMPDGTPYPHPSFPGTALRPAGPQQGQRAAAATPAPKDKGWQPRPRHLRRPYATPHSPRGAPRPAG